jgi:hypothetical protein
VKRSKLHELLDDIAERRDYIQLSIGAELRIIVNGKVFRGTIEEASEHVVTKPELMTVFKVKLAQLDPTGAPTGYYRTAYVRQLPIKKENAEPKQCTLNFNSKRVNR